MKDLGGSTSRLARSCVQRGERTCEDRIASTVPEWLAMSLQEFQPDSIGMNSNSSKLSQYIQTFCEQSQDTESGNQ